MNPFEEHFILASASPRRSELLKQIGLDFTVEVSECDENINEDDPVKMVEALSFRKASAVSDKHKDAIVIGADTVVAYENEILGKPEDEKEALDMLMFLSDRTHIVCTGVSVISPLRGIYHTFSEVTEVTMYENDRDLLKKYISTKEPLDKAGAYGIQGRGAILVSQINGDYNNVVGLPVSRLFRELIKL
ncbi:MAG: Maf family protein [Lachnospiraceae bacterium]|nr:Maf family protein [Lachnospiraceae bacterium]